jgi:hypothetical protein
MDLMRVAFGMKAHSGWAALVVLGERGGELQVVERSRMELVEDADLSWAKQPDHAAEHLSAGDARNLVARGLGSARRVRDAGHEIAALIALQGHVR